MKSIDRRVKELRQAVLDVMNRYGQPLSVDELVLENILQAVRMQMEREADAPAAKEEAHDQRNDPHAGV